MIVIVIVVVGIFLVVFHLLKFIASNIYVTPQSLEFSNKGSKKGKKSKNFCIFGVWIQPRYIILKINSNMNKNAKYKVVYLLNLSKDMML